MLRPIAFSLAALSLAACMHSPRQTLTCDPYTGTEALLSRASGHVIVLGEMHGTNQSPEAVQQIACAALARGEPVRIGLEAVSYQGASLDAALDQPFDEEATFQAAPLMWTSLDGRGTAAVLNLLKQVGQWRADGHEVSVFAFDAMVKGPFSPAARDTAMAENVDQALSGFDGVAVLFTGSFHAQKQPFEYAGETFTPMASMIRVRPVLALEMLHGGGEAWVNASIEQEDGTLVDSIGPLKMGPNGPTDSAARTITLTSRTPESYDGAFFTGPITASPPAFPGRTFEESAN